MAAARRILYVLQILISAALFVIFIQCSPSVSSDGDADGDSDSDTDADTDQDDRPDGGDGDADADYERNDDPLSEVCDEQGFNIARVTPDMLIVLDRSNSMERLGHWEPVKQVIADVTAALDELIWFGLMTFPNTEGQNACEGTDHQCAAPGEPLVECAQGRAGNIISTLEGITPCGGTPIAASLDAARRYLQNLSAQTTHPSYVLLATDGAPNCNAALDGQTCACTAPSCDPNMLNCLDDERTYQIIDQLQLLGIGVFVIGITASDWQQTLDGMASRGGTDHAYMAEDAATIRQSFEEITSTVSNCEFEIGETDPSAEPGYVNFYLDGEKIPLSEDGSCDQGWIWVDDVNFTRVRFCGPHCEQLRNHSGTELVATFGCETLI